MGYYRFLRFPIQDQQNPLVDRLNQWFEMDPCITLLQMDVDQPFLLPGANVGPTLLVHYSGPYGGKNIAVEFTGNDAASDADVFFVANPTYRPILMVDLSFLSPLYSSGSRLLYIYRERFDLMRADKDLVKPVVLAAADLNPGFAGIGVDPISPGVRCNSSVWQWGGGVWPQGIETLAFQSEQQILQWGCCGPCTPVAVPTPLVDDDCYCEPPDPPPCIPPPPPPPPTTTTTTTNTSTLSSTTFSTTVTKTSSTSSTTSTSSSTSSTSSTSSSSTSSSSTSSSSTSSSSTTTPPPYYFATSMEYESSFREAGLGRSPSPGVVDVVRQSGVFGLQVATGTRTPVGFAIRSGWGSGTFICVSVDNGYSYPICVPASDDIGYHALTYDVTNDRIVTLKRWSPGYTWSNVYPLGNTLWGAARAAGLGWDGGAFTGFYRAAMYCGGGFGAPTKVQCVFGVQNYDTSYPYYLVQAELNTDPVPIWVVTSYIALPEPPNTIFGLSLVTGCLRNGRRWLAVYPYQDPPGSDIRTRWYTVESGVWTDITASIPAWLKPSPGDNTLPYQSILSIITGSDPLTESKDMIIFRNQYSKFTYVGLTLDGGASIIQKLAADTRVDDYPSVSAQAIYSPAVHPSEGHFVSSGLVRAISTTRKVGVFSRDDGATWQPISYSPPDPSRLIDSVVNFRYDPY